MKRTICYTFQSVLHLNKVVRQTYERLQPCYYYLKQFIYQSQLNLAGLGKAWFYSNSPAGVKSDTLVRFKTITVILVASAFLLVGCNPNEDEPGKPAQGEWEVMLDKDLQKWDKFIGVPHFSVNLPDYPKGDGVNGTPVGLNKDPLQVFKVESQNGQDVLHISGEIYGGLSTKKEYENYHLQLEFKWGNKGYAPRLGLKRDSGILYHGTGAHGKVANAWLESQEMQVQEGDFGDYIGLNVAIMDIKATYQDVEGTPDWQYTPAADFKEFGAIGVSSYCKRAQNNEKPHGEWNTLELICLAGKSIHIVNGQVVMVLENSRIKHPDGNIGPLLKGKIQLQSEGAEAFYRNIKIKKITQIPPEYL